MERIAPVTLPAVDVSTPCRPPHTPPPPCSGVQSQCLYDASGTIYCPTSFMNPVNSGSTWDDSLAYEMGTIIGVEARALWLGGATEYNGSPPPKIGLDAWSPNINIARDPREFTRLRRFRPAPSETGCLTPTTHHTPAHALAGWGRNQEVASEDPLANGRFGAAYTLGLQNNSALDARYYQAIVTLKHWVRGRGGGGGGRGGHVLRSHAEPAALPLCLFVPPRRTRTRWRTATATRATTSTPSSATTAWRPRTGPPSRCPSSRAAPRGA